MNKLNIFNLNYNQFLFKFLIFINLFKVSDKDLFRYMKKLGFKGILETSIPNKNIKIKMLNLNDCIVSWKIILSGKFNYENGSIFLFSKLSEISKNIIDVGSYTGIFSITASLSNPNSHIYSFEPVSFISSRLWDNIKLNDIKNIEVFNFALGDKKQTIKSSIKFNPLTFTSGFSIHNSKNLYEEKIDIKIFRLDDLNLSKLKIDLIKIDAERNEDQVIDGAFSIISKSKPIIIMEFLEQTQFKLHPLLLKNKYNYKFINDNYKKNSDLFEENQKKWKENGGINVLLFPIEKNEIINKIINEN